MNKYAYTELVQNNGLSSYMEEYLKTMLAVGCSVPTGDINPHYAPLSCGVTDRQ